MKRLIINADDFGISHEVNEAVSLCFMKNYINQTSIMVNMPFTQEAVEMAKNYDFSNKVGLHLNLVEGKPLTNAIKETNLCDAQGLFNSAVLKKMSKRMFLDKKTSECVREEIIAQIELYLQYGIGKKHIDSHQHSHTSPSVLRILLPIMERYEFEDLRLARSIPPTEITGAKKIIKEYTNSKIKTYNKTHSQVEIIAFGSMRDVEKEPCSSCSYSITEMMIHPIMKEGRIQEAFSEGSIETWWKTHEQEFELV